MKIKLTESKLRQIIKESILNIITEKKDLYDDNGFNKISKVHKDTRKRFNPEGYDYEGYDKEGYNKDGWSRDGINKETGRKFDKEGFDKEGFNKFGLNKQYKRRDGRDFLGYDEEGYDENGYHKNGWNKRGINKYTKTKYDKEGWDVNGFNKLRRDKEGFNRYGTHMYGYSKNENSTSLKKIFINEEAFHKAMKLLNIDLNQEYDIHREFNMYERIVNALYNFFKKNKNEVLQIPYKPSLGEYVDEKTGIVIDTTTVGTVINSVMEVLVVGHTRYPSHLLKEDEQYFIRNYINVLYNIVRKHYEDLFKCFTPNYLFKIDMLLTGMANREYSLWTIICHEISEYDDAILIHEKGELLFNNDYDDEDEYPEDYDDDDFETTDDWIHYWDKYYG